MSTNATMTRRNLLKGAAAATAAAAFAPVVAHADEIAWDYEADAVAIGAGASGLSFGIEAVDLGMSAIVLESMPYVGGSSRLCNGGMQIPCSPLQAEQGIEDSPEIMAEDIINFTPIDCDPEFIHVHAEHAVELWDWLTEKGVEFRAESLINTAGQSRPREHHVTPTSVVDLLEACALEKGVTILCDTPATALVVDPAEGRVIGVKATTEDGADLYFKANKGVCISSNGYSRNVKMLNKEIFGVGAENVIVFTGQGDDGSGIQMARKIGAGTRHLDYITMVTAQNPDGAPGQSAAMINVGAIMVNKEGERFVDESNGYGGVWNEVATQTDGYAWQIWDDGVAQEYAENDSSLYSMSKFRGYDGLLIEADTLEELAEKIEVPIDAFMATMEKYNADIAETGVDSAFGRDTLVGPGGTPVALDTPPFYAWKTGNVLYGTTGGLDTDVDARVLDVYGDPIPGLWASGGIMVYAHLGIKPMSRTYVGASGIGFGGAVVWGRIAAQRISEATA